MKDESSKHENTASPSASHRILDAPPCKERIARFARNLSEAGLDLAIIAQHVDIYYFSATMPNAVLLISPSGRAAMGVVKGYERALSETALDPDDIHPIRSLRNLAELAARIGVESPKRIGMEEDVVPVALSRRLLVSFSKAEVFDISGIIRQMRAVKDSYEIEALRKAASLLHQVFEAAKEIIRPGRTELDIAADLERQMRIRGHQGLIRMRKFNSELFYGAVGTGRSTGAPQAFDGPVGVAGLYPAVPQLCSRFMVAEDDTFMVDLVFGLDGYMVDSARMYTFGPPAKDIADAHALAVEVQDRAAERMVEGAIPSEIYREAMRMVEQRGLAEPFMGWGPNKVRFLGHGVGLEVDELPVLAEGFDTPLEAGMAVALEPKFFFGTRAAAGLENTFIVRRNETAECLIPQHPGIYVL